MSDATGRLIAALDFPALQEAVDMARRLAPHVAAVKIGSQLFTAEGPRAVHAMRDLGLRVFLDLKFHDIPNTVAGAVASARNLGVWMLNVHCSGGSAMMAEAAKAAAASPAADRPLVLGVTVLTSLDDTSLQATLGTTRTLREQVQHLTPGEAIRAGADYVVVGRPILAAKDPVEAAQRIAEECRPARAESREARAE
jgi:orotidine-5'-phosphate decarboxylase